MTAPHIIDPAGLLGEALSQASPDLMRSLLQHVINALLGRVQLSVYPSFCLKGLMHDE